ncbi:MAG TPA: hypothetical protein VGB26_10940 [Nitrospiria bacterium]|jgi:hypothetical protein
MAKPKTKQLEFEVQPQPNDSTCGPTCLHAVYRYYGDNISLNRVISEVTPLPGGGTLAVWLACHALRRGFGARIHTYNLQIFDPTWFSRKVDLRACLKSQTKRKDNEKLALATEAYLEFLDLGGVLSFGDLTPNLIRGFLNKHLPILTGLSATYLYGCAREYQDNYDDIRGEPTGHFVVLSGFDRRKRLIMVADPLQDNPGFGSQYYSVGMDRLIGSILLGIVTYDANLLVITPKSEK